MAITIRTDLDTSGAKKGLQELRAETEKTAATATAAGDQVGAAWDQQDAMERLVNAVHEVVQQLEDFRDEAAETHRVLTNAASATDQLGDEAQDTTKQLSKMQKEGSSAGSGIAMAITAANAAFNLAKDAAEGLSRVISAMAEDGNEGAKDIAESFGDVQEELFNIAEDPRLQQMFHDVANVVREDLVPALTTAADATLGFFSNAQNETANFITWSMEQLGIAEQGTMDLLQADQERRKAAVASHTDAERAARKEKAAKKEIFDLEKEMKNLEKSKADAAEKSSLDQIRSLEELLDVIEDTKEALKEENKSLEEQRKLYDRLVEAEKKAEEFRQESDQKEKVRRDEHRAWIAEREKLEIESRQRILAAEAEMLQGINRLRDQQDKQREGAFAGPVGGLIAGANAARNDERKVFEGFVKARVAEAEAKAKAAADQAQARAEEEARNAGADDEGVRQAGREARRKSIGENRNAGAQARAQAAEDWRNQQAGKGTEEERANIQREIDAAKEKAANDYLQQRKKELEREAKRSGGRMTPEEKALIDEVFRIVSQVMHQSAIAGGDMASLQEQIRVLQKQLEALEKAEGERRRRNGGRP